MDRGFPRLRLQVGYRPGEAAQGLVQAWDSATCFLPGGFSYWVLESGSGDSEDHSP